MPSSNDISQAIRLDKDTLLKELAEIEADLKEVRRLRPFVEIDLAKTQERLLSINENLEAIRAKEAKMENLRKPLDEAGKGCEEIAHYAQYTKQVLEFIAGLDQEKNYDEALKRVEALRSRFLILDYGIPLTSQKVIGEIYGHEKAFIYAHKGEDAIAQGQPALNEEELASYAELAANLGTSLNGEKSRHYHLDKIVGFRYDAATKEFAAQPVDKEHFLAMIARDGELSTVGMELSELANARKNQYHWAMQSAFNELSVKAFEGDEYEEALFYYDHRDFIDNLVVVEEAYTLPNETEFHYAYLLAKAEKKNDDEFYEFTKSLREALLAEDEFTLELVARLLAGERTSESHFELMVSELKKTNFELEVICFGKALEIGLSEERQFTLLNMLLREKKKRGDLERMGKYLYYIRCNIAESQKKDFGILTKDLLRSPHAKRAATKSGSPAIHALLGEDYNDPKMPIGKREKNTNIKAWDFIVKGLYFGLAVFLPIGLCIAAYPLLVVTQFPNDLLRRLILIAPIVLAAVLLMLAIHRRYGFDERGAQGWGVGLGIGGILVSAVSLVYFVLPTQLKFLAPYGYSILALGVTLGICSLFLKQQKSAVRVLLTLPLAIVVIAAAVFIVLDSINGTL